MTPVKIASRMGTHGVDGGRWVLVDEQQGASAELSGADASPSGPFRIVAGRPAMALGLKTVVMVAGLAAALWTAGSGADEPTLGLLQPLARPRLPASPWAGAPNDARGAATAAGEPWPPAPEAVEPRVVAPGADPLRARAAPPARRRPAPPAVSVPLPSDPAASMPAQLTGPSRVTALL